MKNFIYVLLMICIAGLVFTGCSGAGNNENRAAAAGAAEGIDLDISVMSDTLAFAQVSVLFDNPDEYFGKTIKISGLYNSSHYEETEQYYHYLVISDASICCKQAVEFKWAGESPYPDDYPGEDTKILITGKFSSYDEDGFMYCYLAVSDLTII